MNLKFIICFQLSISLCIALASEFKEIPVEEFNEELYIKPLSNGFVNSYFQFTTKWHYGEKENLYNTKLTPRAIAEILLHYDVKELHISLTRGLWRYEQWGYPVVDAAPGAEAWAWFAAPNLRKEDVDRQWVHLSSTFSGILCASLNFIDATNSLEPKYGFRPQFSLGSTTNVTKAVRYAVLPREVVCTENLTPWKKLLPCNSKNGLASLLNSGHVHNTHYHSLGIKVRNLCEDYDKNCILEFTETANFVFDPKFFGSSDFSIRRFFGQGLNGHCVLAKSSKIYVDLEDEQFTLDPPPGEVISSVRGGTISKYGVYDVKKLPDDNLFNIVWIQKKNEGKTLPFVPLPPLHTHRYILGYGQERGKLVTRIINSHYGALPIILQENIPWFVPIYMHTMKIEIVTPGGIVDTIKPKLMYYVPGLSRKRAYHLELLFEVPAKSVVHVTIDFDYMFLKWLEYPPDANHGHYLGSAVITTQLPIARNYTAIPLEGSYFSDTFNASRIAYVLVIHTENLIISLPTPDFSMPYNVICLACTVVALAFGPIHSVATKRIVVEEQDGESKSIFGRLKTKIFRSIKDKKTPKLDDKTEQSTKETKDGKAD